MDISIIIACRDAAATLADTLDSLVAQTCERSWEIVLSDNGSTDGSRAIFERWAAAHPDVPMRVVDTSQRPGKPHALNTALRTCTSRWFLFCDADDCVAPGWLAAMARALEREPFVAARMDARTLNSSWSAEGRSKRQEAGVPRLKFPPYCAHAGGATLGIHRSVLETVGEFDPAFAALEDTDYCIRAHLAGFALAFVPDAVYRYRFRDTPAGIRRQTHIYARHRALLRRRYGPPRHRFDPAAWLPLLRTLARLAVWRAAQAVLLRPIDDREHVWYHRRIGWATGELAGALTYGVPPTAQASDLPEAAAESPLENV